MSARKPASKSPGLGASSMNGLFAESSTIVAVAIDSKGKVLLWNRAAVTFFGKTMAQMMGKSLATGVGQATARQLRQAVKAKGPAKTVQVKVKLPGIERVLDLECLAAAPPAAALFLGVEVRQNVPETRPQRRLAHAPMSRRAPTVEARILAQQDLNDELQSRNEELETVNEELQSLNDEMSAMEEQMNGLSEESRRTNDFLRLLLDTSSDLLIACDPDNRVVFWNKAAIKRFRLSPVQAVGSELFELVPALDHAPLRAASRKVRQAGGAGRLTLPLDGMEYLFDPLPSGAGNRRSYVLRIRSQPS